MARTNVDTACLPKLFLTDILGFVTKYAEKNKDPVQLATGNGFVTVIVECTEKEQQHVFDRIFETLHKGLKYYPETDDQNVPMFTRYYHLGSVEGKVEARTQWVAPKKSKKIEDLSGWYIIFSME